MLLSWKAALRSPVVYFYDILQQSKRLNEVSSLIREHAMSTKPGPGFCFAGDSPTMNAHMQNTLENKNRVFDLSIYIFSRIFNVLWMVKGR